MTQEEKDLLLKDLSMRLPYDVKVQYYDNGTKKFEVGTIISCTIPIDETYQKYPTFITSRDLLIIQGNIIEDIKPYLFPLSSMTEEQWNNAPTMGLTNFTFESFKCKCFTLASYTCENDLHDLLEFINWLIANHFDVYGLIPKGLAIDATGLNIY